jgi:rfaE bifunctional protein kinase chain/domain
VLISAFVTQRPYIPDLKGLVLTVVGDFVCDEYLYGQTDRVSREAPVPIVTFERSELRLGGAGNVASNLAALGVRVRAVGIIGKDAAGRAIRQSCRGLGIDVTGLVETEGVMTAVKTRVLAGALHTTRQQLLRVDRGATLPEAVARQSLSRVAKAMRVADALVVSDYGLGNVGPDLIRRLRQLARRVPVLADSRFNAGAFRGVTLVKPNVPELAVLAGKPLRDLGEIRREGRRLLKENSLKGLLVTRGRDGMVLLQTDGDNAVLPVWGSAEAVDVTGAGDTVLACFSAVYAATRDMLRAAHLANVAAGLVVQKPGTATVSVDELASAL